MKKQDRKQAVQTEIERRAIASGVPPELYVYELRRHHTDEGGPRDYVPVKVSENLNGDHYDSSLWPSLMRSARRDGIPIVCAPDDSRMFRDGRTPLADIGEWGHGEDHLLILSERANTALGKFMHQTCEVIPITCATAAIFGYHLKSVENVLDVDKTQANWNTYRGKKRCTRITEYSIQTGKLGRSPIFRTPQNDSRILVLQPVVDAVQENALIGFQYIRVWPHTAIRPVVKIEVKKLPKKKDKRPEPKFSTAATEIAAKFVEKFLGSPLTADGGGAVKLVAYRLPDLSLPSGSIIAADLLFSEGRPFVRRVTPGDYPLTLVAARVGDDERIAFAVVQFAKSPVASWEVATIAGAGGKKARRNYGVDSGNGGFCDPGAQEVVLDRVDPEGTFTKQIEKEMKKSYQDTRCWVHVHTTAGSAAIFSSGFGDGSYTSYFGLDQAGEPVVLVTDFGVLDWPGRPE